MSDEGFLIIGKNKQKYKKIYYLRNVKLKDKIWFGVSKKVLKGLV